MVRAVGQGPPCSAETEIGMLLPQQQHAERSEELDQTEADEASGEATPLSRPQAVRRTGSAAWAGVGAQAATRGAERRRHYAVLLCSGVAVVLAAILIGTLGGLNWKGTLTIGVLMCDLVLMSLGYAPDVVFLVSTCLLVVFGCVDTKGAFEGFSNQGLLAIGALFAVAQALYETGGIELLMRRALGNPQSQEIAVLRCCLPVMILSAFLANTPVVAMMIPLLQSWGERVNVPPSKLLMPLSYASVVGGGCTLIGSSVNLIAANAASEVPGGPESVHMFDVTFIGVTQAFVALVYMVLATKLLPDTSSQQGEGKKMTRRTYRVAFSVAGAPLAGESFLHAGLHRISGAQVRSVERPAADGGRATAVGEDDPLAVGDVVTYSATARAISQLRQLPGTGQLGELATVASLPRRRHRVLAECVCGPRCQLSLGLSYDGAHLIAVEEAVSSSGPPSAGDCCLVECFPEFITAYREAREHFALVTELPKSKPPRLSTSKDRHRMWAAAVVAVAMVIVKTVFDDELPLVVAAVLALQLLVFMQCITWREAFAAVDGRLLLTVASAFGVSNAMEQSGAAKHIANGLVALAKPGGKAALMAAVYVCTVLFGCAISNNAVVLLMTPIVFAARSDLASPRDPDDDPLGWTLLIIFAGSSSFLAPVSYQTNLMVWQPGGYRFTDYARFGFGLTLLLFVIGAGGSYLVAERVIGLSRA
eukprot:TRINITY_DN5161_c0_g1_i2.p1 TRINITY_DN5161_c0_g1~~TRINITY_DN5161_c0_g1_i2.p1  ORF type:complete len:726 (+),score=231.33 TRINITY_DN5161_c0_g1_i2:62-2179(+)